MGARPEGCLPRVRESGLGRDGPGRLPEHGGAAAAQQLRRVEAVVGLAEELARVAPVGRARRPAEAQLEALVSHPLLEPRADLPRVLDARVREQRELVAAD